MLKALAAAPARKVKACGAVKAAAVYKDFVFTRCKIIEILALVIAPVKDTHNDILFVNSDLIYKALADLMGHGLNRVRNNDSLTAIKLLVINKLFLGYYLDAGLSVNRSFALILVDEAVNINAKPFKSSEKIMPCNACAVDQDVRALLDLLNLNLHVAVKIPVL